MCETACGFWVAQQGFWHSLLNITLWNLKTLGDREHHLINEKKALENSLSMISNIFLPFPVLCLQCAVMVINKGRTRLIRISWVCCHLNDIRNKSLVQHQASIKLLTIIKWAVRNKYWRCGVEVHHKKLDDTRCWFLHHCTFSDLNSDTVLDDKALQDCQKYENTQQTLESIPETLGNYMVLPRKVSPPGTRIRVLVNPPESAGSSVNHPRNLPETADSSFLSGSSLTGLISHSVVLRSIKRLMCHHWSVFHSMCDVVLNINLWKVWNRLLKKASIICHRKSVKLVKYWLDPSRFTFTPPVGHRTYGELNYGFKDEVEHWSVFKDNV